MTTQMLMLTLPSLLAVAISSAVLVQVTRLGPRPGGLALRGLLVAILFWSATAVLSGLLMDPEWRTVVASVRYLGIVAVPMAWFAFCANYAARRHHLPQRTFLLLLVMPVATLLLVASNPWHGLHWASIEYSLRDGLLVGDYRHGPAFHAHTLYSYLLMFAGVVVLAWSLSRHRHHRRQLAAVLVAPIPVVSVNLVYIFTPTEGARVDFTPMSFSLGAALLGYALMRHSLMDMLPLARDAVVTALRDPVLAVDHEQRVIDLNRAACDALGVNLARAIQQPLAQVLPRRIAAALTDPDTAEVRVPVLRASADEHSGDAGERIFDVLRSPVQDDTAHSFATVLVLRDITARRTAEQQLRETQRELEGANRALTWLANTDALTGLGNRRHFMERLREETSRAERYGRRLSLLMLDLDHFKRVNDTHGHAIGDRVLVTVARILDSVRRRSDVVGRVGGEEFAMLLPETDLDGASTLAARIRSQVAQTPIATDDAQVLQVTVSVGVTAQHSVSDSEEMLLRRADEALYAAKAAGRNQVRSAAVH